jgi:hypothetical protein
MLLVDPVRRQHTRRVARVDARFLDVLHDAADDDVLAITDGVHVCLERVFQEAIDQHRPVFAHASGRLEVEPQRRLIVHDLHRAPAQHIRRPHEDGIPDALRVRDGFLDAGRRTVLRLLDPEFACHLLEALPVLGHVDRVRRRAKDRHTGGFEGTRQLERRLPA